MTIRMIVVLVVAIIATIPLMNAQSAAECRARWKNSGMKSDHSIMAGCMVQRRDGTWIPSSAVRSSEVGS